jgi:hypothetical protein
MIDYLVSYAHKFAFLAGAAWILGFVALFIFFAVGGIFGRINDAISVLQYLFLIPVALALFRLLAERATLVSFGAAAVGIVAMLSIAALQVLLVVGSVRFEQTLRPILILAGIVGLWWLANSIVPLAHGTLPAGVAWVGVVAGVGSLLGMIGFLMGGQEHPLAAMGLLVVAVSVPIWAFSLGDSWLQTPLFNDHPAALGLGNRSLPPQDVEVSFYAHRVTCLLMSWAVKLAY